MYPNAKIPFLVVVNTLFNRSGDTVYNHAPINAPSYIVLHRKSLYIQIWVHYKNEQFLHKIFN